MWEGIVLDLFTAAKLPIPSLFKGRHAKASKEYAEGVPMEVCASNLPKCIFSHWFGSFVWYTARFYDMINSGLLSAWKPASRYVLLSWKQLFENIVSQRVPTRTNQSIVRTKRIVNVQIIFQTQLPFYKRDTSIICCSVMVSTSDASRKQIGDMSNLTARRRGWWEGTSELCKAWSSEW